MGWIPEKALKWGGGGARAEELTRGASGFVGAADGQMGKDRHKVGVGLVWKVGLGLF